MGYYSRHSIFLLKPDMQKLKLIQDLLEEKDISFLIRKKKVYLFNGETLQIPCVCDVNWNSGLGYIWYDFDSDMEYVSERFNQQYPDETINVYVKTEDGFELLFEFLNGNKKCEEDIVHYQVELGKVCKKLNKRKEKHNLPLYKVIDVAGHPTIVCHYGAYTMIGYNVLEIVGCYWESYYLTEPIGYESTNYSNLPDRIKALQILNDDLEERRDNGTLRKAALGY
jgi:hypothetical protein